MPPSSYGGAAAWRSRTSARRTCGPAPRPAASTAPGLVMYAYAQVGVSLPHSSYALWNVGVSVPRDQLQSGDLVFFDGLGHVGHLHRRRPVRPRAAHRRRREGLEPRLRLVRLLVRRRAPRRLAGLARQERGSASANPGHPSRRLPTMRTTWNGSISFGLVSIPVGLAPATASAARQSDVQFRMLHRECLTPIKQKRWCPVHDIEVALRRARARLGDREGPVRPDRGRGARGARAARHVALDRDHALRRRRTRSTPSTSTAPTTSSRPAPRRSAGRTRCCSRRCARTASSASARSCSPARRSSA